MEDLAESGEELLHVMPGKNYCTESGEDLAEIGEELLYGDWGRFNGEWGIFSGERGRIIVRRVGKI